jgi:predicted transcriptional regulator
MKVKDIMVKDVVTLNPDDTFYDIVEIFAEKKISGAPVAVGKKPVGMVSESDILKFVSKKDMISMIEHEDKDLKEKASIKAKNIMTKNVISVQSTDPLSKVISVLNEKDINRLPVVDDGKIVGIITRADVVSVVSEYMTEHPMLKKMDLQAEEPMLETSIDKLLSVVKTEGSVKIKDLAKRFNAEPEKIEEWGRILEEYKLARMHYPPIGEPSIVVMKKVKYAKKQRNQED